MKAPENHRSNGRGYARELVHAARAIEQDPRGRSGSRYVAIASSRRVARRDVLNWVAP
jgi:hypothetical protein